MGNFRFVVAGKTDTGMKRKNNEDYFAIDNNMGLFIVNDGVGGSASGEVASKMAATVITDFMAKNNLKEQVVTSGNYNEKLSFMANKLALALTVANRTVFDVADKKTDLKGMSTTSVSCMLNDDRLSIAHVGDSRLYLVRNNYIEQLTEDHSLVAEQVRRGIVTEESVKNSDMKNVITRSLGFEKEVEVEANEMTVYDKDIIILCSDGLHTMVSENLIYQTVRSAKKPKIACERLVHFANRKGGKDNITVIVAYIYKKRWYSFLFNSFK